MILAEELTLLGYDDRGGLEISGSGLDYGLAGAILLELALARRVDVVDGRLTVIDRGPTGDPLLDAAVTRIAARQRPRKPKDWIGDLSKGVRERVLDRLVEAGVLRRERDTVLWVFPRTRYPSPSGARPPAELAVRDRLVAAVHGDGPVDDRTAALCALVRAVNLEKAVFAGLPKGRVKARLKEISDGAWAADAVKRAVDEVQAAIVVVLAATVVTTASS